MKPRDFDRLNAIHIAGTKGKGSTAAFVSSILSQYLPQKRLARLGNKVGLYTSPHLRFVRERIQINNEPISEEQFAESFFQIWDRLEIAKSRSSIGPDSPTKPAYFKYLTLMALHIFLKERVGTAIIECGIGGEYDSTNILQAPTVTGITSLGIDHTAMLGATIGEIAWHKGGIMKAGAPAFTAPQPPEAMTVLKSRATEKGVHLRVAKIQQEVDQGTALGLDGEFQKVNASLAIEITKSHLQHMGLGNLNAERLPEEFLQGLRKVKWAGRCEIQREEDLTWHIDGGHTLESMQIVGEWFKKQALSEGWRAPSTLKKPLPPRILLFNQQTRAGIPLLQKLREIVTEDPDGFDFTHAVFCSNLTYSSSGYKADLVSINVSEKDVEELSVQNELAASWRCWEGLVSGQEERKVHVVRTIEDAVAICRDIAQGWNAENPPLETPYLKPVALATGSLHLVGGLLEILDTRGNSNG